MPKFTVTLLERVTYTVEVELDEGEFEDQSDAGDAAIEIWCASEHPTEDFSGQGEGVEVLDIEQVKEPTP